MRYKLLGRSGLRVSELCLGPMTFGEDWGWGASKEESQKIFDTFVEAGGNFIDTANRYTGGTSEKFVGDFIRLNREEWQRSTPSLIARAIPMQPGTIEKIFPIAKGQFEAVANRLC